jgi:hypothetical protein
MMTKKLEEKKIGEPWWLITYLFFSLYDDKIATCSKQSKGYQATTKSALHTVQTKGTIVNHRKVQAKGQLLIIGMQCKQRTIVDHRNAVQAKGTSFDHRNAVQAKGTIVDHRNAVQAKGQLLSSECSASQRDNC